MTELAAVAALLAEGAVDGFAGAMADKVGRRSAQALSSLWDRLRGRVEGDPGSRRALEEATLPTGKPGAAEAALVVAILDSLRADPELGRDARTWHPELHATVKIKGHDNAVQIGAGNQSIRG